jgi:heme/copper-type cytochrome/quinol oxidase subunit 2
MLDLTFVNLRLNMTWLIITIIIVMNLILFSIITKDMSRYVRETKETNINRYQSLIDQI